MLLAFARSSPENEQKVRDWYVNTVLALGESRGNEITSASMNGVSFTASGDSMTNSEWAVILDQVILHLDGGTNPTNKLQGWLY